LPIYIIKNKVKENFMEDFLGIFCDGSESILTVFVKNLTYAEFPSAKKHRKGCINKEQKLF
jgi:hypothetical protein